MQKRLPYGETKRKLVLAFDIGTTHSGVSYCILDPGVVPKVETVSKFPALDYIVGTAKIPTIIYYDRYGAVMAVGAEAIREGIYDQAEEEGWVNCEWFKLHMRSNIAPGASQEIVKKIPQLPPGKNFVDVYADFLAYLYECAATYIKETHPNGVALWVSTVDEQMDFVLSHPNGWDTAQQNDMRKAAVQAGLVPDTLAGHARVSFVTEGEASLYYAIQYGLPDPVVKNGEGVVIVDAGGGTIDVSSYSMGSDKKFKEVAAPECHFNGSVSVSIRAAHFLSEFLADSEYRHTNDIQQIARCFDRTTKLRFRSTKDPQFVKFGTTRDHDLVHNIRYGQLKLKGSDVAAFFDEPIKCIVEAVKSQKSVALKPISHVVLVGGFSSNDWVYTQVSKVLTPIGLNIIRPISYVNKAASDGAVLFYLDHLVTTRVANLSYGVITGVAYDPSKPDQLSNAEVIKLVEVLNTEIMQTAATMAEELSIEEKHIDANAKEQESDETRHAYARTEEKIGSRATELLKVSEHHEDPIIVQIAIQASFARYTHWMISSWTFESPDDEQMLSEIYKRVRETEEQAVSGRWRQLTRFYLQRIFGHNVELVPDLVHAVCNVLVTAGSKQSLQELHERVTERFEDAISRIVKMSQVLNKQIGEGVTSSDLEALYIGVGAPFNPMTMEDALRAGESLQQVPESILCTTDLGLVRAEKVSGTVGEWKKTILLKPKVIMFSGIAEIVNNVESP